VKDRDNGKTLGELSLQEGTVMKAEKRSEDFVERAELLTKDKTFTSKAQTAFSEIFARFATNDKMFPADLANFTAVCIRISRLIYDRLEH
jgi:hypothetical protein